MRFVAVLIAAVIAAGCGGDSSENGGVERPPPPTHAPPATTPATPTRPAETLPQAEEPPPPLPRRDSTAPGADPELFFLFEAEQDARAAAAELEAQGYRVRTTPPADDIPEWSVIAEGTPDAPSLAAAEAAFRAWARALGGRYDGHEIPVGP